MGQHRRTERHHRPAPDHRAPPTPNYLQAEGYVRRSVSDDSYRLNQDLQLSDGYTDDEWISEIANPVLGELLQKVVWPSRPVLLDGDSGIAGPRSSAPLQPHLSFYRALIRQAHAGCCSPSAGRAYLAYCSDEERQQVLRLLVADNDEQANFARNRVLVEQMLERCGARVIRATKANGTSR